MIETSRHRRRLSIGGAVADGTVVSIETHAFNEGPVIRLKRIRKPTGCASKCCMQRRGRSPSFEGARACVSICGDQAGKDGEQPKKHQGDGTSEKSGNGDL